MQTTPVATIDQSLIPEYSTFLQERQQYLRNINKPTNTVIKFDINKQNINEKKEATKGQIDKDKSLTTEQKKKYKSFIDSLEKIEMDYDGNINADYYSKSLKQLNVQDLKEITTYLSTNFDESEHSQNKFFSVVAWQVYEKKLKENNIDFNSNFDKIINLPQYNSVALTYEELKASWLELQSLPSTLTSIYDRNESRDKLSNDNFDKEKESLLSKITRDNSITQDTKTKLFSFVQIFTKSADNKYFSCDTTFLNRTAIICAETQLHEDDLKKIVTELRRYTLNDPLNYGLEDNWGGFNTFVFRNAFNLYFNKLKNLGIANEKDIDSLKKEHPFEKSDAYKLIREQRIDFANELSKQQTTPLVSDNKAIITDSASLETEIKSFCTTFSSTTDKDFDDLGLDKKIVLRIIESNKPSNPYSSGGAASIIMPNPPELKSSDCLKVAKYFLNKSREASESLHIDEDGSKKIQINTYLARVFFWLYEEKLPNENIATSDDLKKLRSDIPFEYIGSPSKSKDNNSYSETDIAKQREKFTVSWNLKILSMPPQIENRRIPFNAQNISRKIDAIISETDRDTTIAHNNRNKFISFLETVKSLQNHQLEIKDDNIQIKEDDIKKFDGCNLSSGDLYTIATHFLEKSNSENISRGSDNSKTIGNDTYLSFLAFSLYEEKLKTETTDSSKHLKNSRQQYYFYSNNHQNQTSTTSPTTKDHSEITNLLKSKIFGDNTVDFTRFFTNILNYDIAIDKALNEIYSVPKDHENLKDFLQESDSELAINLRKYILNKYENIFDTPDNKRSLLTLKQYSAYGVFRTNTDSSRYEKHDLENAKTYLANHESVPQDVIIKKEKFSRDSGGILSLPPSPFSTKAVVEKIYSISRDKSYTK